MRKMNKKRVLLLVAAGLAILVIAAILFMGSIPKWSQQTFEAVVQETTTRPDGEVCLIVQRTTEIYSDPVNSLHISEDTSLLDAAGNKIALADLAPGATVKVTLENSFVEETPFYYPTVYEIRIIHR